MGVDYTVSPKRGSRPSRTLLSCHGHVTVSRDVISDEYVTVGLLASESPAGKTVGTLVGFSTKAVFSY